jgi:prophage regulatory protein
MAETSERKIISDAASRRTRHQDISDSPGDTPAPYPFRLLRLPVVKDLSGLSRSSIYDGIDKGNFPAPIQLPGSRSVAWLEEEILEWREQCIFAARGARAPRRRQ